VYALEIAGLIAGALVVCEDAYAHSVEGRGEARGRESARGPG
jgi:hypothetical protein